MDVLFNRPRRNTWTCLHVSKCLKKHTLFATKLIIKRNIVCIQIRVIRLQQRFHSPKFRKNCYYETFEHLNITMNDDDCEGKYF